MLSVAVVESWDWPGLTFLGVLNPHTITLPSYATINSIYSGRIKDPKLKIQFRIRTIILMGLVSLRWKLLLNSHSRLDRASTLLVSSHSRLD
jgi:hypothetical protein